MRPGTMSATLTQEAKHSASRISKFKSYTTQDHPLVVKKRRGRNDPIGDHDSLSTFIQDARGSSSMDQSNFKPDRPKSKKNSDKSVEEESCSRVHLNDENEDEDPELPEDSEVASQPISRKERRKRRKLEIKESITETNNMDSKEDQPESELKTPKTTSDAGKNEAIFTNQSRSKYGIWVGNLSYKTTAQELARFFEPVAKVTRLNMPKGKSLQEENNGFAYVDFATESELENAINRSESVFGGRKLLIKRSTDFSGRPLSAANLETCHSSVSQSTSTVSKSVRKILGRQKQSPAPCLYFGNLGFETTSQSISSMLRAHHAAQQNWKPKIDQQNPSSKLVSAPQEDETRINSTADLSKKRAECASNEVGIRKVRMGTFEDSGKCKGFAFVDFVSTEHATNALANLKNHRLDGRNLLVEYASAEAVKRGGGSLKMIQNKRPFKTKTVDGNAQQRNAEKAKPAADSAHLEQTDECDPAATQKLSDPSMEDSKLIQQADQLVNEGRKTSRKTEYQGRQKPGAALANARRAPVGIIKNPTQTGKKTVFA